MVDVQPENLECPDCGYTLRPSTLYKTLFNAWYVCLVIAAFMVGFAGGSLL